MDSLFSLPILNKFLAIIHSQWDIGIPCPIETTYKSSNESEKGNHENATTVDDTATAISIDRLDSSNF